MFTDRYIRNLKAEEKIKDIREKRGFGVRIKPDGVKIFFYRYTSPVTGARRFLTLGEYPKPLSLEEARIEYGKNFELVKSGVDPLEVKHHDQEERLKAFTVADLVKEYIDKHAKKFKRSWEADERLLNKEIVTIWGKRKAEDIKKRDVTLLLESIIDRGTPAMSNQALKITRKMFNFAVERDILQHTPFTGVKALAPNVSRERTLTETEIKTLWGSIDNAAISDEIKRAVKLVLVTAQRPGEVSGLHVKEIDGHWWTIPAKRSKNGKEHRVYLTDTALELIGDTTGKGFIFPSPRKAINESGQAEEQPIDSHALPVAVRRNLVWPLSDKKGKPLFNKDGKAATENKLNVDKFTPHDLRRTAATFMAGMGFMDEIIDAVLNHVKQGIIRTYNRHDYDKEKQQALEAWERKLNSITTGTENKVIPMRRKAS